MTFEMLFEVFEENEKREQAKSFIAWLYYEKLDKYNFSFSAFCFNFYNKLETYVNVLVRVLSLQEQNQQNAYIWQRIY